MRVKSITGKSSPKRSDFDRLKAELARADREEKEAANKRKKLQGELVALAADSKRTEKPDAKKQRKVRRPRKRSWGPDRPAVPYPDFPLSPHASGKWVKKVRGEFHYFGRWAKVVDGKLTRIEGDGWQDALARYKLQADDLHAGRTPRPDAGDELTVKSLCNRFYEAKVLKERAGEITARTLAEYTATTDRIVAAFGKERRVDDLASDDFQSLRAELAKRYGPVRLGNEIQRVRTVFKFGLESGLIERPVRFGPEFRKPSKKILRVHRASGGKKLFTADEVRRMIREANPAVAAMLHLGINCAFGPSDVGTLPRSAVNLKTGWIDFARPKTGIDRRCPLWPQTVRALKAALAERPEPKSDEHRDLFFITTHRQAWAAGGYADAVTNECKKLLKKLKINGRRGLGFYSLRHTFRTVADATKDATAIRTIMGHSDNSIDATYTHGVEDDRLTAVADHVRQWLFPPVPVKRKVTRKPSGKAKKGRKRPSRR